MNQDDLEQYEPTRDRNINLLIELTYTIKYQCDTKITENSTEKIRIKKLTQEKMYYNVMRVGNY